MIDLHAHVLPGIDDGPSTLREAVETAAGAMREGVRVLAATPHVRPDHPAVRPGELADRVAALADALAEAGVDVEIVQGGEVDLLWALEADDASLADASYGGRGRDLLVETPYAPLTPAFEDHLFRLAVRGYRIVLAHPERNPTFRAEPKRLTAQVARGTLVQLTADSLAAARSSPVGRFARACVREGVAHVIASDRHGPDIRRASLRAGVDAAARLDGARASWMVREASAAILAGEPLPPAPRSTSRRLRLRGRL